MFDTCKYRLCIRSLINISVPSNIVIGLYYWFGRYLVQSYPEIFKGNKKNPEFFHTKCTARKATHLKMIIEVLNILPSCIPSSHHWSISTSHKVLTKVISLNIPLNRTDRRLRTNGRMWETLRRNVKLPRRPGGVNSWYFILWSHHSFQY